MAHKLLKISIFSFILLLAPKVSHAICFDTCAARDVVYVDGASSEGGDCTTTATAGANRACVDINDALDTYGTKDLDTANKCLEIRLRGTTALPKPNMDQGSYAYTTSAQDRIIVTNDTGFTHSGTWSTSLPRISNADTLAAWRIYQINHVTIDGVLIENTDTSGEDARGLRIVDVGASGTVNICNSIIRKPAANSGSAWNTAIDIDSSATTGRTIRVVNNIIHGPWLSSIFDFSLTTGDKMVIYNNTIVGATAEAVYLEGSGSPTLPFCNNIMQGSGDDFVDVSISVSSCGNNITADATSPDAAYRNITPTYEDAGAGDYRLASSDTGAIDEGDDLSADGDAINTDALGTARGAGSGWDIGFFEYDSGSPSPSVPIKHFNRGFDNNFNRGFD